MIDTREKLEVIAHIGDHITYKEGIGICYDSVLAEVIEDAYMTLKNGVTVQGDKDINVPNKWIPVKDRLPEEDEYVLIWVDGDCQVARVIKGISMADREKMKNGEMPDPYKWMWCASEGNHEVRRSALYCDGDEHGNNRVPYCWKANGGPMGWFGQEVTHWMPLPEPLKGE